MQRQRAVTPSLTRPTPSTSPLPLRLDRRRPSSDHIEDSQRTSYHEKQLIMAAPCAKLFLGDLSFHCSEEEIENVFLAKGYDAEVKISLDFHGKTRGYGFAELKTMELAIQARNELQGMKLHGRTIRINFAGRLIQDQTPINTLSSPINSVYVRFRSDSDITFDEAYLESFFASYGPITDVCIKDVCKVNLPSKRSSGSASIPMFSHQEGFGFVHFVDVNVAIQAAQIVKGDEHTSLDCQFSINLCRSLDGLGNQSPRPLSLSIVTSMDTDQSQSPSPSSGHPSDHHQPFTTSTSSNNAPISMIHNQTQDKQFHTTWPAMNVSPTNNSHPLMIPMPMLMPMPMTSLNTSMSPMPSPISMSFPVYPTQSHPTMVSMPMMIPPTGYPMPSTMSSVTYHHPTASMSVYPHVAANPAMSRGTSQGSYFYPNGGEYYYNNTGNNNVNIMPPMNMTMQPSPMYYNPPSTVSGHGSLSTMVPLYHIPYPPCMYSKCMYSKNNITNHQFNFPIMHGDQATMSEPIDSA